MREKTSNRISGRKPATTLSREEDDADENFTNGERARWYYKIEK